MQCVIEALIKVPTLRLIYRRDDWGLMLRLLSVPPGFYCWIYLLQYSDDSWISMGLFMQTKHLCVLFHYIINNKFGTVKLVWALKQFSY